MVQSIKDMNMQMGKLSLTKGNQNFTQVFPTLHKTMLQFEKLTGVKKIIKEAAAVKSGLRAAKQRLAFKLKLQKIVLEKVQPLFIKELLKVVPEWDRLMKVNKGEVACHSLLVLYLTMSDPVF